MKMRLLSYFNRSKLLANILIGLNSVLLVVLAFNAVPFFEDIGLSGVTKHDLLFLIGCALWVVLTLIIVALKIIVKDAEEDLKAIEKMAEKGE